MINENRLDKAIAEVVDSYPEKDWVDEIKKRAPDADDAIIYGYIEIHFGGDVKEVEEGEEYDDDE